MSEGHFHVHGPHDHEIEHAAHSKDAFSGRIAVMTAINAIAMTFCAHGSLMPSTIAPRYFANSSALVAIAPENPAVSDAHPLREPSAG